MAKAMVIGSQEINRLLEETRALVRGLERISADSVWAHRSSGYRGSLLRQIDRFESGKDFTREEQAQLQALVQAGYEMLVKAAREIGK